MDGAAEIASPGKYAFIDFTRGVAILLVVLTHHGIAARDVLPIDAFTAHLLLFCRMGVPLFFIASALTLCLSSERRSNERHRLAGFYLRRFFRIAPLYYGAILLYGVLDAFGQWDGRFTPLTVAANLTFLHGFLKDAQNDVVPGGWSIGAEMMFYAWFPLALICFRFVAERHGHLAVAALAGIVILLHLALWWGISSFTLYSIQASNVFWYWPPTHVPIFAIGIAAYFVQRGQFASTAPLRDALVASTLLGASLVTWFWRSSAGYTLSPVLAALAFVFAIRLFARFIVKDGVIEKVGRASYSMYVMHFLAVWYLSAPLMRNLAWFGTVPSFALAFLLVVAASYGLAQITHHLIEQPGIALGRRLVRRINRNPERGLDQS